MNTWRARLQALLIPWATLLLLIAANALAAADRPNLILIMADDMGYECVGANGGAPYKTPQLDRLAAEGMRFEHCYVQPLCTPTRVQLMTGIYNQRNYIRFGVLDPEATTFAQLLRKSGYATCIAGKWQLEGGLHAPRHFGFDEHCLWQLNRRPPRYANPGLEINGKQVDFQNGEYGPDVVSDYLCDFIERHKDGPFLAYYPMILPHSPYEPTPDSRDWNPKRMGVKNEAGEKPYFVDMVQHVDKIVGKIAQKVDDLGLGEKTLIIFLGDNGTGRGVTSQLAGRAYEGGKGTATDAGTHVPLICRWTGHIQPKQVNRNLIDSADFFPTLLAAADVKVPDKLTIDGHNFLPQLLGQASEPRAWSYCWYARNGGPDAAAEFARDTRYKLNRQGKLFDLAADPQQKTPLDGERLSAEARAAQQKLQEVLTQMAGTRVLKPEPKLKDIPAQD
jgi:arylsulfatase A